MSPTGSHGLLVSTGEGAVCIEELKPAGKRAMDAKAFIRGYRVQPGDRFV